MTLSTPLHPPSAVVLDWQGLPWTVREAYATPYGFEVYRGYAGTVPPYARNPSWILTVALADHLRTLCSRDPGQLPFLACTVYKMRKRMGLIKLCINKTTSPKHIWTKEKVALLGTGSDRVIGKKLGMSHTSVRTKRFSLGIAPAEPWSPEQLALLGTDTDSNVAKKLGMAEWRIRGIRVKKNIDSFTAQQLTARTKAKASAQAGTQTKVKTKAKKP
jgi:hypothetical protein